MRTLTFMVGGTPMADAFAGVMDTLRGQGHDVHVVPAAASFQTLPHATEVLVVPGHIKVKAEFLDRYQRLRAVVSPFTGVEGYDIDGLSERGILVANGRADENSTSTAEATILLLLAAWYDLKGTLGRMDGSPAPRPAASRMLAGQTVGVIGYGSIGRRVVDRLLGFDVDILVHSRSRPTGLPDRVRAADLDTLMAEAQIVCVCASLNPSTHHLLSAERLALMKPDALLVNTSRGGLVDEAALVKQLAERPDMRVALDVYEVEPLPADSPLRSLPNTLLTPHSVSHTRESSSGMRDLMLENILAILDGRRPPAPVNPEIFDQWLTGTR